MSGFIFQKKHWHFAVLLFLGTCADPPKVVEITGQTMGTTYSIKIVTTPPFDQAIIARGIANHLEQMNLFMSNWVEESDLSRFNREPESLTVSQDTAKVVRRALEIWEYSRGAFDPTMDPLIELWGFGVKEDVEFPTEDEITTALAITGFQHLSLEGNTLKKEIPELTLNLSAIAKGYAVDVVYDYLRAKNLASFMVEVGGEIRVSGKNERGLNWRIGIELPDQSTFKQFYKIAELEANALATSGNYRNYFEKNGTLYTHIIDPRTGYPVPPRIVSASVIAPDCMTADALATTLMILPANEGLELIERLKGVECLLLAPMPGLGFKEYSSSGMAAFLAEINP